MATGNPPKAVDGLDEEQPRQDEGHAKRGQAQRRAAPMPAGVEERDKRGQHAVADAAQRQPHAVRRNAAKNMRKGQVLARRDRDRGSCAQPEQADGADGDGDRAQRSQAPLLIEHHAQRRAQGHCAIGADAVEGDDLGRVLIARRW